VDPKKHQPQLKIRLTHANTYAAFGFVFAIYAVYASTANFQQLDSDIQYYVEYFREIFNHTHYTFVDKLKIFLGSSDYLFGAISESIGFVFPPRLTLFFIALIGPFLLIYSLIHHTWLNSREKTSVLLGLTCFTFHNAFLTGPFHYLRYHLALFIFISLFFSQKRTFTPLASGFIHLSTVALAPASLFRHSRYYFRVIFALQITLLGMHMSGTSFSHLPWFDSIAIYESYATNYSGYEDPNLLKYYILSLTIQLYGLNNRHSMLIFLPFLNLLATSTFVALLLNTLSPSALLAARFSPSMVFFIFISLNQIIQIYLGRKKTALLVIIISALLCIYYAIPYLKSDSVRLF